MFIEVFRNRENYIYPYIKTHKLVIQLSCTSSYILRILRYFLYIKYKHKYT